MANLLNDPDPKSFTERLRDRVQHSNICNLSGQPLPLHEQLDIEALSLAEAGDVDGAKHRLRLWTKPKWGSEQDCRRAYDEAMREKHREAAE
jgi:hypothetical protein